MQINVTFLLTTLAWIFFRANDLNHALQIIQEIFSVSLLSSPYYEGLGYAKPLVFLLVLFLSIEWFGRRGEYAINNIIKIPVIFRWSFYSILIFIIGMFMHTSETDFIYFQF